SPAGMTAPLTPALALAHLHELSVDVRAAVVIDANGEPLAGDAALAERAREALGSPDRAGDLLVARTPGGGAIAALAGDFALEALLRHDLETLAAVLATGPADLPGS
ncbi:MAG TPA: hypothetical protein VFV85_07905, partial [Conexibacter sp.]|nr:hypothetical protein [Conexibacter sp.]